MTTAKALRPIYSLLDVFAAVLKALAKKVVRVALFSFAIGVVLTAVFVSIVTNLVR